MAVGLQAGNPLGAADWCEMRRRAIFDFCKWDVQCEDHSVLARFPLLLGGATAEHLNEAAETLSRESLEAETEILGRPDLLGRLALPRAIRNVLRRTDREAARTRNVRVMRFDFHPTPEGWRISEVNADVPGGFVEASGWNSVFAERRTGAMAPPAPSEVYARAIHEAAGANGLVALVHATAYSDDRQVMQHLARRFAQLGLRTCLLSPVHLRENGKGVEICAAFATGHPDAIVRFFPGEWLPRLYDENSWRFYFNNVQPCLSNPATALVLQTKRFPLVWNELRTDLSTWRRLLPETRDAGEMNRHVDEGWVLKPALGRVGEGIGILGVTAREEFEKIARAARHEPRSWILQRRFAIKPILTETGPKYPCIGVFTINGKAAGFYGRVAETPIINQNAQDAAVLIQSAESGYTA